MIDTDVLKWYELVDEDGETKGSFSEFEEAYKHKQPTDSVKYWDGFNWIINVTSERE